MKWIGQHIYGLISRFRSDVYLEDIDTGTIASGGNLGLDSNNKIVKATEASGDITKVSYTGDLGKKSFPSGDAEFYIVGGTGLTTAIVGDTLAIMLDTTPKSAASINALTGITGTDLGTFTGGTISDNVDVKTALQALETKTEVVAAAGTSGTVELATTAEADIGTDTARAITPAGLKSHVDARYAYQYVMFFAGDVIKSNWITFGQSGLANHTWGTDTSDSGVTVGSSTMACDKNMQAAGFKIPFACKLVGFYGTGHRYGGNNAFAGGVFILDSPDYNSEASGSTVDTLNATLRAYADAEQDGSTGFNQKLNKIVDTSRSFDCPAGAIIFPAFKDTAGVDSGSFRGSMTVVLATPIITIA